MAQLSNEPLSNSHATQEQLYLKMFDSESNSAEINDLEIAWLREWLISKRLDSLFGNGLTLLWFDLNRLTKNPLDSKWLDLEVGLLD